MTAPEFWLSGPVHGIDEQLQPVAHALLQAAADVKRETAGVTHEQLWKSLNGAATVGFHLRHMAGSLERLLTYARGERLSEEQKLALSAEKQVTPEVNLTDLVDRLTAGVESALQQLRSTPPGSLDLPRAVGRAGHPSSVRGLLYHAGEHTARHAGQIVTTVRILRGNGAAGA